MGKKWKKLFSNEKSRGPLLARVARYKDAHVETVNNLKREKIFVWVFYGVWCSEA